MDMHGQAGHAMPGNYLLVIIVNGGCQATQRGTLGRDACPAEDPVVVRNHGSQAHLAQEAAEVLTVALQEGWALEVHALRPLCALRPYQQTVCRCLMHSLALQHRRQSVRMAITCCALV